MTIDKLKQLLIETNTHILFEYNGKECGIDPFVTHYVLWYGDVDTDVKTLDEVVNAKIFDGKALVEIISDTQEWEPDE